MIEPAGRDERGDARGGRQRTSRTTSRCRRSRERPREDGNAGTASRRVVRRSSAAVPAVAGASRASRPCARPPPPSAGLRSRWFGHRTEWLPARPSGRGGPGPASRTPRPGPGASPRFRAAKTAWPPRHAVVPHRSIERASRGPAICSISVSIVHSPLVGRSQYHVVWSCVPGWRSSWSATSR